MGQGESVPLPENRGEVVTEGSASLRKQGKGGGRKKPPSEEEVKSIYSNRFKEDAFQWLLWSYTPSTNIKNAFSPQSPDYRYRGDMALNEMFEIARSAQIAKPSENNFLILLGQVHFWLQEFNHFVISPCDFLQPSLAFGDDKTFRRIIMFTLFKILFVFQGEPQYYGPLLVEDKNQNGVLATLEEWKQFVTLFFPFTSIALWPFDKDGNPRGQQQMNVSQNLVEAMHALEPLVLGTLPFEPPPRGGEPEATQVPNVPIPNVPINVDDDDYIVVSDEDYVIGSGDDADGNIFQEAEDLAAEYLSDLEAAAMEISI